MKKEIKFNSDGTVLYGTKLIRPVKYSDIGRKIIYLYEDMSFNIITYVYVSEEDDECQE